MKNINSIKTALYHVLNGDMLKQQFPHRISGELMIMRECLIDGNLQGDNLEEFYINRAEFISRLDDSFSKEFYFQNSVREFEKIQNIPNGSIINLWFEDDLFCQSNLWFVLFLLQDKVNTCAINLVRPLSGHEYSFGSMNEAELLQSYENKIEITHFDNFIKLWKSYKNNQLSQLFSTAKELLLDFSFILEAVNAHIERFPQNGNLGRPLKTLKRLIETQEYDDFWDLFNEFKKSEAIYGFGDLQVKQLLKEIVE